MTYYHSSRLAIFDSFSDVTPRTQEKYALLA
jgi:hypothetical protein